MLHGIIVTLQCPRLYGPCLRVCMVVRPGRRRSLYRGRSARARSDILACRSHCTEGPLFARRHPSAMMLTLVCTLPEMSTYPQIFCQKQGGIFDFKYLDDIAAFSDQICNSPVNTNFFFPIPFLSQPSSGYRLRLILLQ